MSALAGLPPTPFRVWPNSVPAAPPFSEHAIADSEPDSAADAELNRWLPFLRDDDRRKELLRDNLALVKRLEAQMTYAELVERDEKGKIIKDVNPGGFARLAEVVLKSVPLRAQILGLDLKRTTSGEQLDDANDIADFATDAKRKIATALSRLQRDDAAEYAKARKRLQEPETTE